MNINKRIMDALSPIGIPIYADMYYGDDPKYIVFNYDVLLGNYADDEAAEEIYLVQVHFFAPAGDDVLEIRRAIQKRLIKADLPVSLITSASDANWQHYVFELEAI